jgi:hypothetical protein
MKTKLNNAIFLITLFLILPFWGTAQMEPDSACQLVNSLGLNPESLSTKESLKKGYELLFFELAPCNMDLKPSKLKERISFIQQSNDTLIIEVATVATCCVDMFGEIELKENDTLNLKYTECGHGCVCACCYALRYQIKSTKKLAELNFQLNGESIEEYPYAYPKSHSIREVLGDGTQVLKYFEDDKLKFEKMWLNHGKTVTMKNFKNGLLTDERLIVEYESGSRLKIIKKFDQTGLRSESIYDEEQKVHIERKFDCGVLLKEVKEALIE